MAARHGPPDRGLEVHIASGKRVWRGGRGRRVESLGDLCCMQAEKGGNPHAGEKSMGKQDRVVTRVGGVLKLGNRLARSRCVSDAP